LEKEQMDQTENLKNLGMNEDGNEDLLP